MARRSGRDRGIHAGRLGNNGMCRPPQPGEYHTSVESVVGRLTRRLNVLALLLFSLVVSLTPGGAGAEEPPAPSSVSVWYGAGTSLVRVNTESGQAAGSVPLSSQTSPVASLASHPTDGSVSVLAKGRLLGFDAAGTKTFETPVAAASSLGTAPVLASDPHDGNLWVGGSGVIVLADARGQNQRTLKLNTGEVVKAIAVSQGGGAYVLTQSRILRFSKSGEILFKLTMPGGGAKLPQYLVVDEYGQLAYLANTMEIAQVNLRDPSNPSIRMIKPSRGVSALAVDPFDGTLYVASRPSSTTGTTDLYAYDDASRLLLKKTTFQARAVRALSFDAPSQTLWLGTDSKVLGFHKDFSSKAQIAASGLNTLAAAPLSLASRVSLLEPQEGDTTTNPKQPITLNLKAFCNNEMCPAGFGYGNKLALKASLNGQDVSDQFQITGDAGSASGAEASFTPASGLPEGENTIVAEAVDPFGVRSNHLEASFAVDTTAPSFLEVKPEDGSVITEQTVTITGRVDDPKARVYLERLEDLGGKVISDDPGGFSFEVPLKEGENSFRLLAYDEADNLGEYPLKLIRETPLALTITEPEQGSTVSTDKITVKGTVKGPEGTTVNVGEVEANLDPEGNFVAEAVPLSEGLNSIVVEAIAPNGESIQETLELTYEPPQEPLTLTITEPEQGSTFNTDKITVKGTVTGPTGTTVHVGEVDASVDPEGNFVAENVPLEVGSNTIVVKATAPSSESVQETLEVIYELTEGPLALTITEPEQGSTVTTHTVTVEGNVEGPEGTTVHVGEVEASVDSQGNFIAEGVQLVEGSNSIVVKATAPSGESIQATLELVYEPPTNPDDPPETEPPVDPGDPTARSERPPDSPLPTPGPLPPNPEQVAPPVEQGVPTDMADSTSFLYEGENPVQTGVEPDTIEDRRVAVLKGRVLNRLGEPVPGVRITVLDHPEYGQTLTREDGEFDLAVNGGGTVTLAYEKDRYMSAQRQVAAPWRDFASVDDVILVGYSRRVTDVDLAGTDEMLVAQGSSITDVDGTRQSTVLLPGNTQAEMVMPDGTKEPLPQLDFRATEYTVGEGGPEAMPAPLPPTSGYTYAVELSADEAIEAGAEEVRFSEPVYNYVEDFLGFPVGTAVPSGYYEQEQGEWMGSNNGRVLKILSIKDGLAELDVDGSGNPADAAALEDLGITDEERKKVATLYAEGQVLWRVPVEHLTPWDYNWTDAPPPDAKTPDPPPPPSPEPEPDPECQSGSVIECQNQILGESLDVSGAPFSLHYGSDRVPDYKAWRNLDIPVSDSSTLPGSLRRIELEIEVAGQTFAETFPSTAGQSYRFTWDGKDAYGRTLTGEQVVRYRVGYTYPLVYRQSPPFNSVPRSWAVATGEPSSVSPPSREVTLWKYGQERVASWQARDQGIGGWTPDILHQYDPDTETLLLGNGDRHTGRSFSSIANTFAGSGGDPDRSGAGDFRQARQANMKGPAGVAAGPDGSFYIADALHHRIRQVWPDGIMTTVAGHPFGFPGFSGDGGPADQAFLFGPRGIAVGNDGSIYVADTRNHRIRQIGPDGSISTIAGNGTGSFGGDGGPATQAQLNQPGSIAVAPDSSLYIADTQNHRIRRVGPEGIITTVAGTGVAGFGGDGGPATKATLDSPWGVAVAPDDGSLYIADRNNNRIRRVGPEGIITTVAGTGVAGSGDEQFSGPVSVAVSSEGTLFVGDTGNHRIRRVSPDGSITTVAGTGIPAFRGDGGPASLAAFNLPWGVTLGPDGPTRSLYIADLANHRVRQVEAPRLPRFVHGEILLPAEDGSEVYVFDAKGRHLRTLDATTGTVLYSFSYDEKGRLTAVEDVDGLATTVERDTSGNATAIIAPNGDRTDLTLDANSYLASVSNPAGETTNLDYDLSEGGLLQSLTDPKNNTTRFSYNELGRLTKDEDPAGGFKTVSRTEQTGRHFTTSLTTTSGRKNTYEIDNLPDGSSRRTNTDPSGLKTETFIGADGTRKLVTPDGTTMEESQGPDPRFGMQAPVANKVTVKTPGGLSTTTTTSRQATFEESGNPLSATTLTDTVTTNGKVWTTTWDKAAGTTQYTSPEGRSTTTTVDAKGRPILEESPGSAPSSYEYDGRGRLTKIIEGTGTEARTITYTYDAKNRVSSMTDPSSREWRFEYDTAGRVVRQVGPNDQAISYAYDRNGNLTSITPPGQPTHEFGYDNRNLATSYNAPQVGSEDRATGYDHDLDRLPTSQTLPGGGKIEYAYDEGGRLKTLRYPEGEKNYSYDATTGNLATASNASGTLSYAFDGFLPLSEASTGQVSGQVGFKYDSDMRLAGVSVNGGPEVSYSYDNDNLVTKAGALDVSRDAQRGLITGTTLSGVTDQSTYNAFAEPESYEALSGSSQLYKTTYERDSLGRIIEKTETVGGESTTYSYSYDEEGNLKEVKQDGNPVASYTYDANGNRLSRTTPSGTTEGSYDAQDRLTAYGDNQYSYTPDGQLKTKTDTATGESTSYSYDSLGNLLSVTLPDGKKIEYVVDAADRRVGKKVDGQLVEGFLYQGQLAPVAELDGSGNIVSRFVYATNENVPDYMEKGGKTYRIIADQVGSVRLVVDAATGEVVQRIDYDEFGNVLNDTNPGFQPFGFAGGLYDPDTKFTRFGARDYDAETARWTAKDPILFAGGDPNLYSYALGDPINRIDPSGLRCFDFWKEFEWRFKTTNEFIPGLTIPPIVGGAITAGATARLVGANTAMQTLMLFVREVSGRALLPEVPMPWGSVAAGTARAMALNWVASTVALEGGIALGALIGAGIEWQLWKTWEDTRCPCKE